MTRHGNRLAIVLGSPLNDGIEVGGADLARDIVKVANDMSPAVSEKGVQNWTARDDAGTAQQHPVQGRIEFKLIELAVSE